MISLPNCLKSSFSKFMTFISLVEYDTSLKDAKMALIVRIPQFVIKIVPRNIAAAVWELDVGNKNHF